MSNVVLFSGNFSMANGPAGPAPTLNSFTINGDASSATANPGDAMTLNWSVSGATKVQLSTGPTNSDWVDWPASGSATVSAMGSRNFSIRARNGGSAWPTFQAVHSIITQTTSAPDLTGVAFSDNLTRANSSSSINPPSDGQTNYVALTGIWGISGDAGYNVDGATSAIAYRDTGSANVLITLTAVQGTNSGSGAPSPGIAFRIQDANNYWFLSAFGANFNLFKVVAGVATNVGSPGFTGGIGSTNTCTIYCQGDTIWCPPPTFGGPGFILTDATFNSATKHGLWCSKENLSRFLNFNIINNPLSGLLGIPDFCANPTIESNATGNWSASGTWNRLSGSGATPVAGDVVAIRNGHTVTMDVFSDACMNGVGVQSGGSLKFATNAKVRLTACHVIVYDDDGTHGQGYFEIGNSSNPINPSSIQDQTACLALASAPYAVGDINNYGAGLYVLGKMRTYGQPKSPGFVGLATAPSAGDRTLSLASAVTGWTQGDRLFIPESAQRDYNQISNGQPAQYDVLMLESVSADGKTLTVSSVGGGGLLWNHPGSQLYNQPATPSEYMPHVVNLSRWASIRTVDPTDINRPHILITNRANVDLQYTTIHSTGRAASFPGRSVQFRQLWGPQPGGTFGTFPATKYATASGVWTSATNTWTVTDPNASVLLANNAVTQTGGGDWITIGTGYVAQIASISNIGNAYTVVMSSTAASGTKPADGTYTMTCGYLFSIQNCSVFDPLPIILPPASTVTAATWANTTTIAAGSNGAVLPQSTINVVSTAGFSMGFNQTGQFTITIGGSPTTITYTGFNGTQFLGCTGGSGTLSTGQAVNGGAGAATLTAANHGVSAGQIIVLKTNPVGWQGPATSANASLGALIQIVSVPDANTLTYALTSNPGSFMSGSLVNRGQDIAGAQWGITMDEASWGVVKNNVSINWSGAGIAIHNGNEQANTIVGNFAGLIRGSGNRGDLDGMLAPDQIPQTFGYAVTNVFNTQPGQLNAPWGGGPGTGVWERNPDHTVQGNVAADIRNAEINAPSGGGLYTYAYTITPLVHGTGSLSNFPYTPAYQGANPYSGVTADALTYYPILKPIKSHLNNVAYSCLNAFTQWMTRKVGPNDLNDTSSDTLLYGTIYPTGMANNHSAIAGSGGILDGLTGWNINSGVGSVFLYPMLGLTVNNLTLRGTVFATSGNFPAVGLFSDDYSVKDITIQNCDIQGFGVGIFRCGLFGEGYFNYSNCYLNNQNNILIRMLSTSQSIPGYSSFQDVWPGYSARRYTITNCTYGTFGAYAQNNIQLDNPTSGQALGNHTSISVIDHNGVVGDNFNVYFVNQGSHYVMPPTNPTVGVTGCPQGCYTNAQLHDRYNLDGTLKNMSANLKILTPGICYAGILMPPNVSSRADVTNAFVRKPVNLDVVNATTYAPLGNTFVRSNPQTQWTRMFRFRSKFNT